MKFLNKSHIIAIVLIFFLWTVDFIFQILFVHFELTFNRFLYEFFLSSNVFYRITSSLSILALAFIFDRSIQKIRKSKHDLEFQHQQTVEFLENTRKHYEEAIAATNEQFFELIEQKNKYQKILEESERKHRKLLDQLPVGVYRTAPDGSFLYANQALANILGFDSVDELMKASAFDFYPSREVRQNVLEAQSEEGYGLVKTEIMLRRKDGRDIFVQDFGQRIFEPETGFTYFDGVILDVTENVLNRRKLEESEKRYRTLFEQITDLYIQFDTFGSIQDVSPSASMILGYNTSELIGMNLVDILQTEKLLQSILSNDRSTFNNVMFICHSKDGSTKFLNGDIITLYAENGKKIGYSGVLRDVSNEVEYKNFMTALVRISRAFDEQVNLYSIGAEILHSMNYIFSPRNFVFGVIRPNSNKIEICYQFDRYGHFIEDLDLGSSTHPLVEVVKTGISKVFYEKDLQFAGFPKTLKVFLGVPLFSGDNIVGVLGFYSYSEFENISEANHYYISTLSEHIAKNLYRKLIEEQLNFQIQLFETLIEAIPYPICYQNIDTREVLICNTPFVRFLKRTKHEVIGHSLDELFDANLFESIMKLNEEIQSGSGIQTFDYIMHDRDTSKQFFFTWIRSFLQLESLRQRGVVEILIDVTERAQYEQQIAEALEFNRNILELVPSGILVVDTNGIVRVWNREAEKITGIPAVEVIGNSCKFCQETEEKSLCPIFSVEDDKFKSEEFQYSTRNKEKKILRKKYLKLYNTEGKLTGAIESFEDITESVLANERMRFLAESNARLTNIASLVAQIKNREVLIDILLPLVTQITNSRSASFLEIREKDGLFAVEQLFTFIEGNKENTHIGQRLENFVSFPFINALYGNEVVVFEMTDEKELSKEFDFLWNKRGIVASVRSGRGIFGILLAFDKDETYLNEEKNLLEQVSLLLATNLERIQYEEEINSALVKEFQLNELRSNFISLISHEYRTPLQAIMLSADILQKYADKLDSTQRNKQIERIQKAIKDMTAMIDNVILYNKLSREIVETNLETVSVKLFFESLLRDFQLYYEEKAKITFDVVSSIENVTLDPNIINLIFQHLIANAVKYSMENPEVYVKVEANTKSIKISVKDNGIGISNDEINRIFDPFFRGEKVKTLPGTGLGLSIVKNAVDKFGGSIHVESLPKQGTTLIVELPIIK